MELTGNLRSFANILFQICNTMFNNIFFEMDIFQNFDGDFALVRRTDSARDGEIVVALVNNEEATLKYLHRDEGRVRLDPANATHEPQVYDPGQVQVQGKLAGLLRRYH